MLLVHHFLEHGGGIYAGDVIVLEGGHERHGACGDYEMVGVDIRHLLSLNILDANSFAFEQIPYRVVQQNTVVVVASKSLGNIEATHSAEFLFLLEEKELVGLHIELSTDMRIVVYYYVVDIEFIQLLAAGKSGGACSDDCHLSLVNLDFAFFVSLGFGHIVLFQLTYFFHVVYQGDADASYLSIYEHLAGSAFSDSAFQASWTSVNAVTVDGVSGLMKSGGDSVAFSALNLFTFIIKFHNLA